jgi:hypothetical protein
VNFVDVCTVIFGIYILIPQFLRHQTMDKVQKHNSFNINTPSSESSRNYRCQYVVRPLWVQPSWGVFPDERMGLSVASRYVFFVCHYPEDKALHNMYKNLMSVQALHSTLYPVFTTQYRICPTFLYNDGLAS